MIEVNWNIFEYKTIFG
jgi:hypothetical protein